jgi:hypothetical protein
MNDLSNQVVETRSRRDLRVYSQMKLQGFDKLFEGVQMVRKSLSA